MEPVPREKLGQYGGVVWREVSPGMYLPAEPYRPLAKSDSGWLVRYELLLGVIVGANIVREFWPWFPYLGIAVGLSYAGGRLDR